MRGELRTIAGVPYSWTMGVSSASGAKPSVLLVDDDESQRVTACALLEDRFDVKSAANAKDALVLLQSSTFDVLCADFQMPGMNGLELLERVAERYPHVGCVLITGHRDFLNRESGTGERLVYAVLLKPYAANELVERVERAAQLSGIRRRFVRRESTAVAQVTSGAATTATSSDVKRRA
jgi:DNA-binding NtrC family response regulator